LNANESGVPIHDWLEDFDKSGFSSKPLSWSQLLVANVVELHRTKTVKL
jgi:hypothetical protein